MFNTLDMQGRDLLELENLCNIENEMVNNCQPKWKHKLKKNLCFSHFLSIVDENFLKSVFA